MKLFNYARAREGFRRAKRGLPSGQPTRVRPTKQIDVEQNDAIKKLSKKITNLKRGVELKQLQNNQSSYANPPSTLTTTLTRGGGFTLALLNGSIQGTSTVTRIGDKIKMTSFQISGQIYPTAGGATLGYNIPVRIICFLSKKPKGVVPSVSTSGTAAGTSALFYNTGGGGPTTYQQYDTGVNMAMYENYKILVDKTYTLKTLVGAYVPSTDADNSVNPFINFNIRKKLGIISDYSRGNAGGITDMEANALYVVFITDTNGNLTVELDARVYFQDL